MLSSPTTRIFACDTCIFSLCTRCSSKPAPAPAPAPTRAAPSSASPAAAVAAAVTALSELPPVAALASRFELLCLLVSPDLGGLHVDALLLFPAPAPALADTSPPPPPLRLVGAAALLAATSRPGSSGSSAAPLRLLPLAATIGLAVNRYSVQSWPK
jgi:hypothetical protein